VTESSVSLPWLFQENGHSTSLVGSSSSMFSGVNQSALTTHNWGLDFCGGAPCELTQGVVCDATALNATGGGNARVPNYRTILKRSLFTSGLWYR